jgi:hypothetical protein
LAVSVTNENRVKLYRNSGAGFFVLMGDIKVGRRPSFVIAADLNGDGFTDFATADKLDDTVTVLLHNRHISPPLHQQFLPKRTYLVGDGPVHLAAGFFNNDARIDLIVANEAGNCLAVLNSTAPGVFNNRKDTPTDAKPACLAVSDFDGDGFTDVGYICRRIDKAHVRLGKNNGTFKAVKRYAVGASPRAIVAVDIDVNEHADLAVCNYAGHSVSLLLNDSTGRFGPPLPYFAGVNPLWICSGDIDGDFDDDVVTIGKTIPTASVLVNTWF